MIQPSCASQDRDRPQGGGLHLPKRPTFLRQLWHRFAFGFFGEGVERGSLAGFGITTGDTALAAGTGAMGVAAGGATACGSLRI